MTNRFMMSVAAVALIAGAGFANAQGTGTNREQPGSTAQPSAPSSDRGNSAQSKPSSDMKATQSDEKAAQPNDAKSKRAQDDLKAGQKGEKSAQDNMKGEKSKSMSSETKTNEKSPAAKDMKAEGRDNKMNAEQKGAADSKSTTTQSQSGTSTQSQTTGQAGAGAKLSTEQRTRITSVIREQHVQPLANVNFSIAVGTRVPRDVRFYPLPREVVTIYPEWRGYEFVLVNNQIIVIDPRTFEIVAILEA
jgi:Protein of unknown function (DUF1236)